MSRGWIVEAAKDGKNETLDANIVPVDASCMRVIAVILAGSRQSHDALFECSHVGDI